MRGQFGPLRSVEKLFWGAGRLREVTLELRKVTYGLKEITSKLSEVTSGLREVTSIVLKNVYKNFL